MSIGLVTVNAVFSLATDKSGTMQCLHVLTLKFGLGLLCELFNDAWKDIEKSQLQQHRS